MIFVFDFGEVIQIDSHVWGDLFEKLGYGRKNVRAFGPRATKAVNAMMVGAMEEPEFWKEVQADIGETFPCDNLLYKAWNGIPVPGMEELILELKSKGYRVICGTNNIYPFYKKIKDLNLYKHFDKVYSSYDIGIAKPDPEFWKFIAREENVKTEDMFFVDDRLENCQAAESLGVTAHNLVNGVPALRKHLESLGIL